MKSDLAMAWVRLGGSIVFLMLIITMIIGVIKVDKAITYRLTLPAPVDASSPTSTVIDGEVVKGGMAVLEDVVSIQVDGVMEDGTYFPHADAQVVPEDAISLYVTHYGPPSFPVTQKRPACASGYQVPACLYFVDHSMELFGVEVDGFCAVNDTPWDTLVYPPVIIEVEGMGKYLVMDHKDRSGVDIYEVNQESFPGGYGYSEPRMVWEVTE